MPQDKDRIRILHMIDAAERITAFTNAVSKEVFIAD